MTTIRQAAVAGMFYPGNPWELESTVDNFIASAETAQVSPRALIVPHAGYIYSGPVAATAYKALIPLKHKIKRVILAGPSHRVPFYGCALSSADYFSTPLGKIPVDQNANQALVERGLAKFFDAAHAQEHSLEVHLPFLQRTLEDFLLVPIVVGEASADEVADIFEFFWSDEANFFVVSSDLSHYHPYNEARQIDTATSEAIVHLHPERIGPEQACGVRPVNGLLKLAQRHHLSVDLLDLRNSGDTAGDKTQVVGYGAYAIHE